MMVWAINLIVLAIGLFIVGMIKPNWLLFWMDKPGRMPIIFITAVILMSGMVMFGEANIEQQQLKAKKIESKVDAKVESVPAVVDETAK